MRLDYARWPSQDHVARLMNNAQRAQFPDLTLFDGGLEAEVVLVKCLEEREVRQSQTRLHFAAQQILQAVCKTGSLLRGLLQQVFQLSFHSLESESVQSRL
jgi:hypothetical protein